MKSARTGFRQLGAATEVEFTWDEIHVSRSAKIGDDQIAVSYYKNPSDTSKNALLHIRFGEKILNSLKAAIDERLLLLQAREDIYNYLLVKGDNGYKIQPYADGQFQISFRFHREGLEYFKSTICTYFANKNHTVRIVFPG